MGVVPEAVSVCEYWLPTVPLFRLVVVIVGAVGRLFITIVKVFLSDPALFLAVTTTLYVPACVGTPESLPLLIVIPSGSPLTVKFIGLVPLNVSCCEY